MRIPKRIKLSGQWFVIKRTDLPDANGLMEPQAREIHLAKKMPPGALGVIFMHELWHAIIEVSRPPFPFLEDEKSEEHFVGWATSNFYAALIDNKLDFLSNGEHTSAARRRKRPAKKVGRRRRCRRTIRK